MDRARLDNLAAGALDPYGQQVAEVYARNGDLYGVYRTAKRVCVQFADAPDLEAKQRAWLAPLGQLRSDINGLINGWRRSGRHRARAKTKLFDRLCADALISAMEQDATGALYQLTAVRDRIMNGRVAIGRFQYLGTAFMVVLIAYLLLWLTSFRAVSGSAVTTAYTGDVLIAVAGGALGAFLSIAIMLKGRTVLPDLQWVANLSDAVLRMTVGIVAAAIFLCLLRGGFGLTFATATCDPKLPACDSQHYWMQSFALGFVAGFFERLVPDLLEKVSASVRPDGQAKDGATAPPALAPTGTDVPEPATADADARGDCLCNQALAPADVTADTALPPATGGVASTPPPDAEARSATGTVDGQGANR